MSTDNQNPNERILQKPRKGDRVEVVKILILAVLSFVLGFGLVIFFLSPKDETSADEVAAPAAEAPEEASAVADEGVPSAPVAAAEPPSGYAPSAATENPLMAGLAESKGDDDNDENGENGNNDNQLADEADAPVEVPPGKTPEGLTLDGNAFYLKCWDSDGQESPGSACDPLSVLEKRFSTRLYVIDKCKQTHAGAAATGKLSIGMEVNFADNSVSFWNGASSTLENAAKVGTCLRNDLKGLPIHSVNHKYTRYRLFFTVVFGKGAAGTGTTPPPVASEDAKTTSPDKPAPKLTKGKTVEVVMDHVRVRKTPVDGAPIGKISAGNQVTLLGQKGEWCRVLTPNGNEGWMICESLKK